MPVDCSLRVPERTTVCGSEHWGLTRDGGEGREPLMLREVDGLGGLVVMGLGGALVLAPGGGLPGRDGGCVVWDRDAIKDWGCSSTTSLSTSRLEQ